VDETRQTLLSHSALTRDEDRRVDLRDPPRKIERPKHRRTRADKTGRHVGIALPQRPARPKLPLFFLERVGQLRQPRIQAGLLLVKGEVRRQFRPPLVLRANDRAADRVAFAAAAILDGDDLLAVDARHVAAGEARQGPADRLLRLAEMQQMLLGLIRIVPDTLRAGRGAAH